MPAGAIIGAGIGMAGGVVNSLLAQGQAKKNQKRQFDHNKQMAELEYNRNTEMWNKNNAYNTPQSQMERFSKAGLNKNLIYGQGSPGNATQQPQYQVDKTDMEKVPALNTGPVMEQYNSYRIANAQIDRMEQQTKLDQQKTVNEGIQTLIMGSQSSSAKSRAQIDQVLSNYSGQIQQNIVDKGTAEIKNTTQNTLKTKSQTQFQDMINTRAKKEKIYPGDSNIKTLYQIIQQQAKKFNGIKTPTLKW